MEHIPIAILMGLVSYALVGCAALVFPLWCIRGLHTHIQAITPKHRLPMDTVCRTMKDTSFPAWLKSPESTPTGNVFSTATT